MPPQKHHMIYPGMIPQGSATKWDNDRNSRYKSVLYLPYSWGNFTNNIQVVVAHVSLGKQECKLNLFIWWNAKRPLPPILHVPIVPYFCTTDVEHMGGNALHAWHDQERHALPPFDFFCQLTSLLTNDAEPNTANQRALGWQAWLDFSQQALEFSASDVCVFRGSAHKQDHCLGEDLEVVQEVCYPANQKIHR